MRVVSLHTEAAAEAGSTGCTGHHHTIQYPLSGPTRNPRQCIASVHHVTQLPSWRPFLIWYTKEGWNSQCGRWIEFSSILEQRFEFWDWYTTRGTKINVLFLNGMWLGLVRNEDFLECVNYWNLLLHLGRKLLLRTHMGLGLEVRTCILRHLLHLYINLFRFCYS